MDGGWAGGPVVERGGRTHRKAMPMARCEVCGNEYDKAFQVMRGNESWTFDSFECAIEKVAPKCAHCGCRIIGHGMEKNGAMYCCAHCAKHEGVTGLKDRAA